MKNIKNIETYEVYYCPYCKKDIMSIGRFYKEPTLSDVLTREEMRTIGQALHEYAICNNWEQCPSLTALRNRVKDAIARFEKESEE